MRSLLELLLLLFAVSSLAAPAFAGTSTAVELEVACAACDPSAMPAYESALTVTARNTGGEPATGCLLTVVDDAESPPSLVFGTSVGTLLPQEARLFELAVPGQGLPLELETMLRCDADVSSGARVEATERTSCPCALPEIRVELSCSACDRDGVSGVSVWIENVGEGRADACNLSVFLDTYVDVLIIDFEGLEPGEGRPFSARTPEIATATPVDVLVECDRLPFPAVTTVEALGLCPCDEASGPTVQLETMCGICMPPAYMHEATVIVQNSSDAPALGCEISSESSEAELFFETLESLDAGAQEVYRFETTPSGRDFELFTFVGCEPGASGSIGDLDSVTCLCRPCGDGFLDPSLGEECDDGNVVDGDCCSSSCLVEPKGNSCDDGDACTAEDQCDGAGSCVGVALIPEPGRGLAGTALLALDLLRRLVRSRRER